MVKGVCSVMWGRKRLTVTQLRRDKAALVSSIKGTQTPPNSTMHVLKDTRAELTECMGVDELAPACRGPDRGPTTAGAERQTLEKWLSFPQCWHACPLAGHVGLCSYVKRTHIYHSCHMDGYVCGLCSLSLGLMMQG